jgi:uncharacterized protein (TIGR03435 family)
MYTLSAASCAVSLSLVCVSVCGQTPPQLSTFEVASVKPDPSPSLRHVLLPPVNGRFSTRGASLRLLIQNAYGVQSFQISGGPEWMNSSGFVIEARAEGNPDRSQIWLMLQSLLEDRFKLKVHRENKVLRAYFLTAAKNGLKLSKPTEGDCVESSPARGQRPLGPCASPTLAFEPSTGLDVVGRQVGMADLIKVLSGMLERPIIDKTDFSGKFDVNLRFAYEQAVTVGIGNPWGTPDGDATGNPSIMTALQQQLGLRLVSGRGPVEVLVVDHAERPSEN